MRILFLSRWYPYPANNGSKLRINNLLQGLSEKHEVALLSFAAASEITPEMEKPLDRFAEIRVVSWKPYDPHSQRARTGLFNPMPRSFIDTFSPEMAANLEEMLATNSFDLVIASQINMAAYARYFQHIPALFEEAEVGVLFEQYKKAVSPIKRLRYGLTWAKHRRFLRATLAHFKATTVVSSQEEQLLAQAVPNHPRIQVVPNGVDLTSYQDVRGNPRPNTIIFTGAFSFEPNFEAMNWFTREVFPLILAEIPEAQLTITGNHQGRSLPSMKNITLAGFVDDVRPLIAESWCSVVPILSGGGTRLKILEAMALRTPVVATSKGAEGLELQSNRDILIADQPQEFAKTLISLLGDPVLRQKLASNALRQVQAKYDWPVIMPDFMKLVDQIVEPS